MTTATDGGQPPSNGDGRAEAGSDGTKGLMAGGAVASRARRLDRRRGGRASGPPVLHLGLLRLLQLGHAHLAEPPLPQVEGLLRDPHLPAELRRRRPCLSVQLLGRTSDQEWVREGEGAGPGRWYRKEAGCGDTCRRAPLPSQLLLASF